MLLKESKSFRKLKDNLDILFTNINSLIALYKKRKTVENQRTRAPWKNSSRSSNELMCNIIAGGFRFVYLAFRFS